LVGAIIVAAGSSTRMHGADKLFADLGGRPLLAHTLARFQESPLVERIVLVLALANIEPGRRLAAECGIDKLSALCEGGRRRQDSVRLGLEALRQGSGQALGPCEWVLVHDGARPLVTTELIERGLAAARETGAAVAAVPIADTVKQTGPEGTVERTLDRKGLWAAQTPQVFRYDLLLRAHREVTAEVTDDAAMLEALGLPVKLYEGSPANIKVTTPEDLRLAEAIIRSANQNPKATPQTILHITRRGNWEQAKSVRLYRGDTLDSEGFIHCSTENQVLTVANTSFRGQRDLVLLCIDLDKVGSEVRFEGPSADELFPHIYGPLNLDAIFNVLDFEPGKDGKFQLPGDES
jgi:2-C-methyl-D-erythritol 4-phosphate cytidylyltransferase